MSTIAEQQGPIVNGDLYYKMHDTVKNLVMEKPTPTGNGVPYANINIGTGYNPMIFQTGTEMDPLMEAPFGISTQKGYEGTKASMTEKKRLNMNLNIHDPRFAEFGALIDEHMISILTKNGTAWYPKEAAMQKGKVLDREYFEARYRRFCVPPAEGKEAYGPSLFTRCDVNQTDPKKEVIVDIYTRAVVKDPETGEMVQGLAPVKMGANWRDVPDHCSVIASVIVQGLTFSQGIYNVSCTSPHVNVILGDTGAQGSRAVRLTGVVGMETVAAPPAPAADAPVGGGGAPYDASYGGSYGGAAAPATREDTPMD